MKNTKLLQSEVNKTFEEILWMTEEEFRTWVRDLRKTVVDLWDNEGLPPRVGFTTEETVDQFRKMVGFPVHTFETVDENTGAKDVIRNTSVLGNAVNDWFPTMMKTGISYSTKTEARSIYDYFARDEFYEKFVTYASRHFKRDSFYHYSYPISYGTEVIFGTPWELDSIEKFFLEYNKLKNPDFSYFLCPVKPSKEYTGYNVTLKQKKNIILTYDDVLRLEHMIEPKSMEYTRGEDAKDKHFNIRVFQYGQKVFPVGLKAFRVSFCQYAVNFPPLTARYLYERFTEHIKDQEVINIYDPSSGWGGRILGAMSVSTDRNIHYIGTDPNTDHIVGDTNKYSMIANFFNDNVRRNQLFPKMHTHEIFLSGSEVIGDNPDFQKYKGKLDMVFTSPPYFAKEVYSDDPEQSCHKFSQYEDWKNGFLYPTLKTAVEYLRHDRYLLWNIADAAFDGVLLPLEEDSRKILEQLGMTYVMTLKMALAQMPGGNRTEESDDEYTEISNTVFGEKTEVRKHVKGKMKNFCMVKSNGRRIMLKYEPIFVFHKP